jgi:HEAT repeat protein
MTSLSDDELMALVLGTDQEASDKLLHYRQEVGQVVCVRQMLSLFEKVTSEELCKESWRTALTICLTDDEPEMDEASSQLWTAAFLRALQNERPEIRKTSALLLQDALSENDPSERIIRALVEGLADESEDVRWACGDTLQFAGATALPYLLQAFMDERYRRPHQNPNDRRSSVWDVLCAIDGLLKRSSTNPEDRRKYLELVTGFLRERSVDDGMDYLDIWKAGETLGETIGGREALQELSLLINHTDPRVRQSVAHALSHIKDPEARNLLRILADDPIEDVRLEASKYLKIKA